MATNDKGVEKPVVSSPLDDSSTEGESPFAQGMLADLHLFLTFVEESGEGIGWADLDGSIRYANTALVKLIGAEHQDDVHGTSVIDLYDEATQRLLSEEVFPQILEGTTWTGELTLQNRTGQSIPTMNRLFVLRNTDGSPSCFGNLVTDLQETKKAEDKQRKEQLRLEEMVVERTSELTRANESLRNKEHTIESASSAITTYSLDGDLSSVNPAFLRAWGYRSEEEVRGKHITEFWLVGDHFQEIQEALDKRGTWSGDAPARRKDGSIFYVQVSAAVLRDGSGEPVGWMSTSQDITERKHAQDLIRDQRDLAFQLGETRGLEASLKLCLELAIRISGMDAGGIYLVDEETGCVDLTHSINLTESFTAGGAKYEADSPNAQVVMSGRPIYFGPAELEAVVSESQREEGLRSLATVPVQNEGRVIACVNVASHRSAEIPATVRNALEATVSQIGSSIARARAQDALRSSEETLRIIGGTARDTIVLLDDEDKINYWSAAGQTLLGYSSEDVIGKTLTSLLAPPRPHDDARETSTNETIKTSSSTGEYGRIIELDAMHKDGSEIPVEVSLSFKTERGSKNVVGIVRDIRERREAAEAREQLETQLLHSQKMEAIGRLAGGVAHDFNNILTGIVGYADMAQRGLRTEDPLNRDLEEIHKAADRAATLTKQLLAFSRKQVIAPRVVQPNDSIDCSRRMLQRTIGEDIQLDFIPSPDLWRILVDPTQLDQIFVNLAVNARDAMTEGGKLTYETRNVTLDEEYCRTHNVATPGDYVMLVVSDTGTGMDEQTRSRVFEPFFSTKAKDKGTGLGLSTVYGIVQQHNGHIDVSSEVGAGTSFKIYFPRELGRTEAASQIEDIDLPSGTETVLLVEDEEIVRKLALRILESNGYTVIDACSGGHALSVVEKFSGTIELLLTDVIMPAMNGRELFNKLSTMRTDLKVLYMSGYTEDVIAHHGVLDEGTQFIPKPFNVKELLRKVRTVLDS